MIMASVPTTGFLVSPHLYLLRDFVKDQDESWAWGWETLTLARTAFWCAKIWMGNCQHCCHRTWDPHFHVSGAFEGPSCYRQAALVHHTPPHALSPTRVRVCSLCVCPAPCCKLGPGTDSFVTFAQSCWDKHSYSWYAAAYPESMTWHTLLQWVSPSAGILEIKRLFLQWLLLLCRLKLISGEDGPSLFYKAWRTMQSAVCKRHWTRLQTDRSTVELLCYKAWPYSSYLCRIQRDFS